MMNKKKFIGLISTTVLTISAIASALDRPPYVIRNILDGKETFKSYAIDTNFNDVYVKMSDKASTTSNNTFTGQNTFTQTPVIPTSGAGYVPVGSIQAYISSSTIPSGWLYCNGQSVSTTTYSALYAAIGFTFGNPGGGNMNLPDLRGMFLRGLDNGRGLDSDAYRVIGSTEADRFQGHWHQQYYYDNSFTAGGVAGMRVNIAGGNNTVAAGSVGQTSPIRESISDGTNGTPRTANETAPKNVAVTYIIKY